MARGNGILAAPPAPRRTGNHSTATQKRIPIAQRQPGGGWSTPQPGAPVNNHSQNGQQRIPIAQRQPGGPSSMPMPRDQQWVNQGGAAYQGWSPQGGRPPEIGGKMLATGLQGWAPQGGPQTAPGLQAPGGQGWQAWGSPQFQQGPGMQWQGGSPNFNESAPGGQQQPMDPRMMQMLQGMYRGR